MAANALPMPARAPARASRRILGLRGDPQLVARVRAGDSAAFEVLYQRHLPGILSFCRHMLGSREEAEDAVQMVFVAAHRQLLADDREINLKPWLYAIARNRCLSMLRARREEGREGLEVATDGLQEEVQRRFDLRELLADLQDLPDNQRAALVLSELGDLSHVDVAQVLDCEPGQVKGLVFRARSGLAERRDAREANCEEIRVELANATGGGLRRGRLHHHVKGCTSCAAFLGDMRRQRRMLSLILPVAPTVGLKGSVLGAIGGGTAGGGAAAATAAGASAASMAAITAAKVAVVGVLAGAGVVAATEVRDRGPAPEPGRQSGKVAGNTGATPASPAVVPSTSTSGPQRASRRASRRAAQRREPGSPRQAQIGTARADRADTRPGSSGRGAGAGVLGRGKSETRGAGRRPAALANGRAAPGRRFERRVRPNPPARPEAPPRIPVRPAPPRAPERRARAVPAPVPPERRAAPAPVSEPE